MTVEEREQEEAQAPAGPTRHAKIMRGVVTPIFGLIAVACIVLGVLNATMWKPSREITAAASVSGTRYVVTDPGVLGLVDDQVTMTVESDNAEATVCVAEGALKDVVGWIAGNPYVRVTGLSEWTVLSVADNEAQGEDQSGEGDVAFADSDMWNLVECGTGSVTLATTDEDASRVVLVDLGEDDASAQVSMDWVRQTVPDFAMPFYFAGGISAVLAVLSASVFAMPPHKRRKKVSADAQGEPDEPTEGMGPGNPVIEETGRRTRRRHGRRKQSEEVAAEGPAIVDPAARNLVSDQLQTSDQGEQDSSEQDDAGEQTSVISPDELAAYFVRFAQESSVASDSESSESESAESESSESESADSEPVESVDPESEDSESDSSDSVKEGE